MGVCLTNRESPIDVEILLQSIPVATSVVGLEQLPYLVFEVDVCGLIGKSTLVTGSVLEPVHYSRNVFRSLIHCNLVLSTSLVFCR